jgi:hypothetical protein
MPGYSYDELTKVPFVMGVISEFRAPGSTLQRFYNLGLSSRPGQILPHRTGVYDIFNPTRTMPIVTAPMRGPARVARKPVSQKQITVPRFFEALVIEDEYVFRNRPLGGQYGQVDETGQTYIARQIRHETQKFVNVHEFMAASLFRGGWSLKPYGEDLYPVPKGTAGTVMDINSLMPAEHQEQIPLGTAGADIIATSWADASADIVGQLLKLNKVHAARHGAPLRHIWLNGTTIAPLFNNTKLQAVGGSVFRIFDSMSGKERNPDERYPDTGVDVVFRAMPEYTFHVYNQVVIPDRVRESTSETFDSDNYEYLIPDNEVFITPDPGDWCELIAGSEPMQYAKDQAAKIVTGFDMGRAREIFPPRWDLMFLANQCPVLTQQYAVYNPTVIFT